MKKIFAALLVAVSPIIAETYDADLETDYQESVVAAQSQRQGSTQRIDAEDDYESMIEKDARIKPVREGRRTSRQATTQNDLAPQAKSQARKKGKIQPKQEVAEEVNEELTVRRSPSKRKLAARPKQEIAEENEYEVSEKNGRSQLRKRSQVQATQEIAEENEMSEQKPKIQLRRKAKAQPRQEVAEEMEEGLIERRSGKRLPQKRSRLQTKQEVAEESEYASEEKQEPVVAPKQKKKGQMKLKRKGNIAEETYDLRPMNKKKAPVPNKKKLTQSAKRVEKKQPSKNLSQDDASFERAPEQAPRKRTRQ